MPVKNCLCSFTFPLHLLKHAFVPVWNLDVYQQRCKSSRIIVPISLSVIISQNVPLPYTILFSSMKLVFFFHQPRTPHDTIKNTWEPVCARKSDSLLLFKWGIESFNRMANYIMGKCWIIGSSNNTIGCYCQLFELWSWMYCFAGVSYYQ